MESTFVSYHMSMCLCAHVCKQMCIHVCGCQRSTVGVFFSFFESSLLRQDLSLYLLARSFRDQHGSASSGLVIHRCCHAQLFRLVLRCKVRLSSLYVPSPLLLTCRMWWQFSGCLPPSTHRAKTASSWMCQCLSSARATAASGRGCNRVIRPSGRAALSVQCVPGRLRRNSVVLLLAHFQWQLRLGFHPA